MERKRAALALAVLLCAGAATGRVVLRADGVLPAEEIALERIPLRCLDFAGRDLHVSPRVLAELHSDDLLLREYSRDAEPPLWLCVDYHRVQKLGAQVHSPRHCYPGAGWAILSSAEDWMSLGERTTPVRWLVVEREGERRLLLYWYETRWGPTSREIFLKGNLVRSAFARRATDAALCRLTTPLGTGPVEPALLRLREFLAVVGPHLEAELPFRAEAS
jgi:EpsI family protein